MSNVNEYLANQVYTASPERLQLMLLEAVMKCARRADELLTAGSPVAAGLELAHGEAIMADLIGSLRKDLAPALVAQVGAVYGFILQSLADTHISDDPQPLRAAMRMLEVELDTWRLVCQRTAGASAPSDSLRLDSLRSDGAESAVPKPSQPRAVPQAAFDNYASPAGGFSFEA
ncbi:MAG: flagellar protein FliS [Pirellulales bacterium]